MMRRLLAALLAVGLLAGCGSDPKLTEGEVIDKKVDPESTYITFMCVAWSNGFCMTQVPITHTDPADWLLLIEGEADGKTIQEWHDVGVDAWNDTEPGDWWEKAA